LGDEGDAFSAAIPVNCPHKDEFRSDMRDVGYDSKKVEDGHFDEIWPWSGEVRGIRCDVSEEREAERRGRSAWPVHAKAIRIRRALRS